MAHVAAHVSRAKLEKLVRQEKDAPRRDRLRLVLMVMDGRGVPESAQLLGYSVPWGWKWMRRFNEDGPEGLRDKPRPGQPHRLSPEQEEQVREFVEARARDTKASCRVHGAQVCQFINEHLGVSMSLSGAYVLLHRLGYELIQPRPRHEKNDPAKMREWKEKTAPLLSKKRAASTREKSSRSGSRTSRASGKKGR